MSNKKSGFTLINAIFLMLILVIIGMGISTISSISLDSSVTTKDIAADEQKVDGIVNVLEDSLGTEEEDEWFSNDEFEESKSKGKVATYIFIDNVEKEFNFSIEKEYGGTAYITLLDKKGSDWVIGDHTDYDIFDTPTQSSNSDSKRKLYKVDNITTNSAITTGIKITGGTNGDEYQCIIRIFKD